MPCGLMEVSCGSLASGKWETVLMIVQVTTVGESISGEGRLVKTMLVIADDGELDETYGRKLTLHFCSKHIIGGVGSSSRLPIFLACDTGWITC